jgi:CheY-like chemotaxis protein
MVKPPDSAGRDIAGSAKGEASHKGSLDSRLSGMRVLVVDDESDAREMIKLMLAHRGVDVRTAASASEALMILEEWRPDVLISDIGMPNEDGYSLIESVRSREWERVGLIPAVALTGYAGPEDRRRLLAAGYQICLAKPIEFAELVVALSNLAGRPMTQQ